MQKYKLNDANMVPCIGLGTVHLNDTAAREIVCAAIKLGYRLFDTASRYGNEEDVGYGMQDAGIDRKDLFVTSKVRGIDHGFAPTMRAFEATLERLRTDYLDLYLIHWPLPQLDLYVETWRALVQLRQDGLVKSIGVSNFLPHHIDRLFQETGVLPSVNQIQLDPHRPRPAICRYNSDHGILTQSWGPIGQGRPTSCLFDPVISQIADKHYKTAAQVILRWHLQRGLLPIPKTGRNDRLLENISVFDFELDDIDLEMISEIDQGDSGTDDPDTYFEE